MKRRAGKVLGLALTWDGARWPVRSLPQKARDFLAAGQAVAAPSPAKLASFFATAEVKELRICWVPLLKGGKPLCVPFALSGGKRIPFRAVRQSHLGDILAVAYRRA